MNQPQDPEPKRAELKAYERSFFGHLSHWLWAGWDRLRRGWFRWAHLNQQKPWFLFVLAAVVAVDGVLVLLPGDVLVALAVLSNPAGWRRIAFYAGMGGTIGAFCLYLILHQFGKAPLQQWQAFAGGGEISRLSELNARSPDLDAGLVAVTQDHAPRWHKFKAFFARYGLFSLALGSLLPLFSWPVVILAGLSTDRWWEVLFWLFVGRQARYWLGCFGLREGWAMFQALREEAQSHR
jgi:membrane protein YqaA with SNARE-associated domain